MRRPIIRMIAGAAALAAFALGAQYAGAQDAMTATPERAATLTIAPPRSADDVFLNVFVKAYRPPRDGMAEAVVSVAPAGGGFIEVGRFTFFPAQAFTAGNEREHYGYRLDASAAIGRLRSSGGNVTVRVALTPLTPNAGAPGATLTLAKAEFGRRPQN